MNRKAITVAREIHNINSKSAKWIASNALNELESNKVQEKLRQ
nr:hypothetical protein [Methanobacterium formicicum]